MKIKNATAVVTGGARGIGYAIAESFAHEGAKVALIDLRAVDLERAAAKLRETGVEVRCYAADVTAELQVEKAMRDIADDFGSLDVLINNAGIVQDGLLLKVKDGELQGKLSLDRWQSVINVNLTGVFLCGREAAANMVRLNSRGVIINISSVSRHGNAGQTNYSAAKAGVQSMAVVWAKELARFGIRAAAIAPGFTRTDILTSMKPETLERMIAPVPVGRLGEASEIASAAMFIVANDFFNGRCLDVDGGLRL